MSCMCCSAFLIFLKSEEGGLHLLSQALYERQAALICNNEYHACRYKATL